MIELKELIRLYESDEDVRIVLNNGTIIIGEIVSVDDEEESGFSESGSDSSIFLLSVHLPR